MLMGKQKCYNSGLSVEVLAYALFDQKASTLPFIRSISFQPSNGSYLEEYIPLAWQAQKKLEKHKNALFKSSFHPHSFLDWFNKM